MKMPLCDNKECKGYHKTELEECEFQSHSVVHGTDPGLYCPDCMKVYDTDDFVDWEEWDVDVDEDGPFITTAQ